MEVPSSSSTAAEASQAAELEAQKLPSIVSGDSETEMGPDCPLHGADYDSIIHFDMKITTLDLSKEYFEEAGQGIIEYSQLVTMENDKADIILSEKMVNHLYTAQVLALWDFESPMADYLLGQVSLSHSKSFGLT